MKRLGKKTGDSGLRDRCLWAVHMVHRMQGLKSENAFSLFRVIITAKVHRPEANDLQNSVLSARLEICLKPCI
jgi:hypothetical protein